MPGRDGPSPPRHRRSLRHPSWARRLLEDERGASLGEYLIAVGCIAIGGMTAFAVFGEEVRDQALSQVDCLFEGGAREGGNRELLQQQIELGKRLEDAGRTMTTERSPGESYVQSIDAEPLGTTGKLAALRWDKVKVSWDDPVRIPASELTRLR